MALFSGSCSLFSITDYLSPIPFSPPVFETLVCHHGEITRLGPAPQRVEQRPFQQRQGGDDLADAPQFRRHVVTTFIRHRPCPDTEDHTFDRAAQSGSDGITAVMQQMMMQLDVNGTNVTAVATERRGIAQVLEIRQTPQMWRDDRAYRALVGRVVRMATHTEIGR